MQMLDKNKLKKGIEEIAMYDLESNKVFGSGYLVMQRGEVAYKGYFGYASADKRELGDRTMFRLASMTKPFTAIAALILVERGLLSLEDRVSEFIPAYKDAVITKTEDGKLIALGKIQTPITVRHLLTHTSGIGSSDLEKAKLLTARDRITATSLSARYASFGVDFEPDSRQCYSGVAAFAALGVIIERLSGKSLQEFYTEEIFKPCGMQDTTFIPSQEQWSRLMAMHGQDRQGNNITVAMPEGCLFEAFPCTHCVAGAGLASTLTDYAKFATMLLHKGKTPTGRILSEAVFAEMSKPRVVVDASSYWGLGVRVIGEGYPCLSKGTFGWSGAYGSHFWVDPENEIVAVFMKNSKVDGGSANCSAISFENAVNSALV